MTKCGRPPKTNTLPNSKSRNSKFISVKGKRKRKYNLRPLASDEQSLTEKNATEEKPTIIYNPITHEVKHHTYCLISFTI